MRVLFDQATPVPIRPFLKGYDVRTAAQEGWDTLRNGELLNVAEEPGSRCLSHLIKTYGINRILRDGKLPLWWLVIRNGQCLGCMSNSWLQW
jgi:hypothetical protein